MQLKKNKLKTENDKHLFLDGKLSEYGIGLKEACHRPAPPPSLPAASKTHRPVCPRPGWLLLGRYPQGGHESIGRAKWRIRLRDGLRGGEK